MCVSSTALIKSMTPEELIEHAKGLRKRLHLEPVRPHPLRKELELCAKEYTQQTGKNLGLELAAL